MLGDMVRTAREKLGWSQSELARRAGLTSGHISQIESGKRPNPRGDVVQALAQTLGISAESFYANQRVMPPEVAALQSAGVPDKDLQELAAKWAGLSADDQQLALVMVRSMWKRRHKDNPPGQT